MLRRFDAERGRCAADIDNAPLLRSRKPSKLAARAIGFRRVDAEHAKLPPSHTHGQRFLRLYRRRQPLSDNG